ncbi:hypothetical protein TorRG33x02_333560, partial [Trema orientale]
GKKHIPGGRPLSRSPWWGPHRADYVVLVEEKMGVVVAALVGTWDVPVALGIVPCSCRNE